jgi:guanylate kinase
MTGASDNCGADLVAVSGPSGTGKTTVVHELLRRMSDLTFSVSATTRSPRGDEREGVDYYFLTRAEFQRRVAQGRFIEHAEVFGQMYGTPVEELARARRAGRALVLDIDVQGCIQIRRKFPRALLVLLVPPSMEELRDRLRRRGTETEEAVAARFSQAARELKMARQSGAYDAEVVNDDLTRAVEEIRTLIQAHRRKQDDRSPQE